MKSGSNDARSIADLHRQLTIRTALPSPSETDIAMYRRVVGRAPTPRAEGERGPVAKYSDRILLAAPLASTRAGCHNVMMGGESTARAYSAPCVRQPYANLISGGFKTVEPRRWETPDRDPLVIVAGKTIERHPDALRAARLLWRVVRQPRCIRAMLPFSWV